MSAPAPSADPDRGVELPVPAERPGWRSPRVLLGLMIASFAAVSCYAGAISFFDFQTRNAVDLTIFMQALTSTIRGHPAPFYESFDCMTKARCSFLLVHPSPVLYLAVPFYAAAPTPLTLFALQSLGVGLAAAPLYVLTRTVTGSEEKGLVAALLYLVWAPTLGGEAFSFHLEAFLPLALFTLAMFWALGRYRLGLLAALAGFLVLEVAPVFAFLIGAFFLSYSAQRVLASLRDSRSIPPAGGPPPSAMAVLWTSVRSEGRRREVRYTVALMAISAAAFVLLFAFMNVWGARLLGVAAPPLSPGLGGVFYENSSPGTQSLATIFGGSQWHYTLLFWVVLYLLVAFVPLLAPRTLVVALPWVGYTFLTDTTRYVQIGSQYTAVAAVPIFLGLAYGLRRVPSPTVRTEPDRSPAPAPASPASPPVRARRRGAARAVWGLALALLVAGNVLVLPIDPLLGDLGVTLTNPFQPEYQDHSLTVLPGFGPAELLVGRIPASATVTAPAQVFGLVANYPRAFVLLGAQSENDWGALPLNLSGGPDDVLLYPSFVHSLSRSFGANLTNASRYGMEAWVGATTVGPLLLYARGVTGPATLLGPSVPTSSLSWTPSNGSLVPGPVGTVETIPSAPNGTAIAASAGTNRSGVLWSTSAAFLAPGSYTVRVLATATGGNLTLAAHHTLLTVMVRGFGAPAVNASFGSSDVPTGGWVQLSFALTCSDPIPALELQGYFHADGAGLTVAAVSVEPVGPS